MRASITLKSLGFEDRIVVDTPLPPRRRSPVDGRPRRPGGGADPANPLRPARQSVPRSTSLNPLKKPLVFVVNSATARARITSETAGGAVAARHGGASITLHHRVDFAASMIDGLHQSSIPADSKSAREISALWMYLRDRLVRLYGADTRWAQKGRSDFATAVLTPESAYRACSPGHQRGWRGGGLGYRTAGVGEHVVHDGGSRSAPPGVQPLGGLARADPGRGLPRRPLRWRPRRGGASRSTTWSAQR